MGALAVRQALFWQVERKKPHAERAAGWYQIILYSLHFSLQFLDFIHR